MSSGSSIPLIFKPSDTGEFPVSFEFNSDQDVRVYCVDACQRETLLDPSEYSVSSGKVCLNEPRPDCIIVIEHFPCLPEIAASKKPLSRDDMISIVERYNSRLSAMEHRLSLAVGAPISQPCPPVVASDPMDYFGLWSEGNEIVQGCNLEDRFDGADVNSYGDISALISTNTLFMEVQHGRCC